MAGVLVLAEADAGGLRPISFELITAGVQLAESGGGPVRVLIVSRDPSRHGTELSAPGVDPTACKATYDPQTELISQSPRCANPCIQEIMVPGMWVSDDSNPPITHVSEGRLPNVAFDRHQNIWFDQGYLDRQNKFHLCPPVLALTNDCDVPTIAYHGIGGVVAVDPRSGDIWATDYIGRRLNRLHPEP